MSGVGNEMEMTLNGNENIVCHPRNANCHIFAFKGYENYRASLLDYGYADTEAAVEKYIQDYIDDPDPYFFNILTALLVSFHVASDIPFNSYSAPIFSHL